MKHFFVINPKSFTNIHDLKRVLLDIENCFSVTNRAENKLYFSRYPRDAVAAVYRYIKSVADDEIVRVYAVGGDGITFDCLNGLVGFANAELACVPYGNSNDFIRSFGEENKNKFYDIEVLSKAPSIPTDLIQCGPNYAINSCSIGIEALAVLRMANINKAFGKWALSRRIIPLMYKLGAAQGILENIVTKQDYKVIVDGNDLSGNYGNLNIGNTAFNGGDCSSNPYAVPNDGWLDVVSFKAKGALSTLGLVSDYTRGGFEKYPKLMHHRRFKEMTVSSEKPMYVVLDGEAFFASEISFKILPGAVRFVAPEGLTYRASKVENNEN